MNYDNDETIDHYLLLYKSYTCIFVSYVFIKSATTPPHFSS